MKIVIVPPRNGRLPPTFKEYIHQLHGPYDWKQEGDFTLNEHQRRFWRDAIEGGRDDERSRARTLRARI